MKDRPPLFIECWDPHCHNCKKFKSDWDKLISLEYFKKKIMFADINCISEKILCQKISPGKEYPRFVWFNTSEAIPRSYTGSYSLPDLALWIKSQFQSPIDVVNDEMQFEKIKQVSLKISLFRFIISESDKRSIQILTAAVNSIKHLHVKIVLSYSNQQISPLLEHFTPDNRVILMNNEFSHNSIINFIKVHSIRFFIPYNNFVGQFSSAEKVSVFVLVFPQNNSQLRKYAIKAAKAIEELSIIPITQLCCEYDPYFCRYYGITNNHDNIKTVILDKSKGLFWSFEYKNNISSLQSWTAAVLNQKIAPFGPGSTNKFIRPLSEMFYELRGQGGWLYYAFFTPVIAFVAFIITLGIFCATPNLDENHISKSNCRIKIE